MLPAALRAVRLVRLTQQTPCTTVLRTTALVVHGRGPGTARGTLEYTPNTPRLRASPAHVGSFFRKVGAQNEELYDQMVDNVTVYDAVADSVEKDPVGIIELPEG